MTFFIKPFTLSLMGADNNSRSEHRERKSVPASQRKLHAASKLTAHVEDVKIRTHVHGCTNAGFVRKIQRSGSLRPGRCDPTCVFVRGLQGALLCSA